MSSIMRRRSGLMGVVVLIGVLLVLRWRLLDPSTLKTGTSHPVTAPWCSHHSLAICQPTFPARHRLARSAFVPWHEPPVRRTATILQLSGAELPYRGDALEACC